MRIFASQNKKGMETENKICVMNDTNFIFASNLVLYDKFASVRNIPRPSVFEEIVDEKTPIDAWNSMVGRYFFKGFSYFYGSPIVGQNFDDAEFWLQQGDKNGCCSCRALLATMLVNKFGRFVNENTRKIKSKLLLENFPDGFANIKTLLLKTAFIKN